jgi:maleylpyruvate isomerase
MRVREVWVHAVDLGTETSLDDVPHEVCAALVDDVATAVRARTDVRPVVLRAGDSDRNRLLGAPAADPVVVTGDIPSLAAYATGRARTRSSASLPQLRTDTARLAVAPKGQP